MWRCLWRGLHPGDGARAGPQRIISFNQNAEMDECKQSANSLTHSLTHTLTHSLTHAAHTHTCTIHACVHNPLPRVCGCCSHLRLASLLHEVEPLVGLLFHLHSNVRKALGSRGNTCTSSRTKHLRHEKSRPAPALALLSPFTIQQSVVTHAHVFETRS